MSWDVSDDEWLSPPNAAPGTGPVDKFDDQVIKALSEAQDHPPGSGQDAGQQDAPQPRPAEGESVPPPPHSAAFDNDTEAPSYESGSFIADPQPDAEPEFHIPTLSLGSLAGDEPHSAPTAQVPRTDTAPQTVALEHQVSPVVPVSNPPATVTEPLAAISGSFVIPTLSRPQAVEVEVEVDEVEAEELEVVEDDDEFVAVPVRTGDTVIARAPEFDSGAITNSVYDDDDDDDDVGVDEVEPDSAGCIPEIVERVDSSELEFVHEHEDTAVEAAPNDPDTPELDSAPIVGGPVEAGRVVIPNLARSEAAPAEPAQAELPPETSEVSAGVIIPTLFASLAADQANVEQADAPPAGLAAVQVNEVEEVQEVDSEAIESLDTADLEELEQPRQPEQPVAAAIETAEVKPPPPAPASGPIKRRKAWYDDVFAEHFLFLCPQSGPQSWPLSWEATCERDAQFMFSLLGAREGMSVLDVGCGDGHHAVQLATLGARVTGLDNSLALLLAAAQVKEAAEFEDGRVEFIHGDMRRLPRDREFDAVVCVGTTLGYFEEDQNWLCLQEMHDRLLPGGRLLIHVFNRDFVAPHLPSRSWWQGKRCMVIDEAEMNFFANRLRVHRTIIFDDGRQFEHHMFMRAYTVQDLGKAISQLGMRVLEVSGSRDTRGRFYGSASPDIWIVAEKK